MIIVISPAKSLDFETPSKIKKYTTPQFLDRSEKLINKLRTLKPSALSKLMGISEKLADLNYERNMTWHTPFTPKNAKQAAFAFTGDVYTGLEVNSFTEKDIAFAQEHLRILSGLYGVLKPLDLIQPYRLEMGTKLQVNGSKNLYEFWDKDISNAINTELEKEKKPVLINLASNEYFKSVKPKLIKSKIITPEFKEFKGGKYKVVMVYAKKARGMMCNYIIKNKIKDPEKIKGFNMEGYAFDPKLSTENDWVFTRG